MTRLANNKAPMRQYRSDLRAQQVEETRARILEAALRVMADGFASVSIPNVAREAGVAVPTIASRVQRLIAGLFASVRENATSPASIAPYPSVTSACAMNQSGCLSISSIEPPGWRGPPATISTPAAANNTRHAMSASKLNIV
jgi:hypothetical protein